MAERRGDADAVNDRARLLLRAVVLASWSGALQKVLTRAEERREMHRCDNILTLNTSI